MKNKPLVTTVIIVGFIAAALLVAFFWPGDKDDTVPLIVLPAEGTSDSAQAEIRNHNRELLSAIEVDTSNIREIIGSLHRSGEYRIKANISMFSGGREYRGVSELTVRGELARASSSVGGRETEYLLTKDMYYSWEKGENTYYSGPRGESTPDSAAMLPTWEDAAQLPPEYITDAGFGDYLGVSCLTVTCFYPENSLEVRHYISVDWGLLIASENVLAGRPIYTMAAESIELSAGAAKDTFRLPDGSIPK